MFRNRALKGTAAAGARNIKYEKKRFVVKSTRNVFLYKHYLKKIFCLKDQEVDTN